MNNIPTVTKNLLIINVLAFFGQFVMKSSFGISLSHYLGLHFFLADYFNAAQLFTYMFMHSDLMHLFFNMFAVWMFGRILEQVWGPRRFLFYYLVCGIGAGVIQEVVVGASYYTQASALPPEVVETIQREGGEAWRQGMNYVNGAMASLNATLNTATVGASGAVYAILLAFGMLFPNERMYVFPLPMPIKAKYFVIGYAAIELYAGLANNPGDNVAHFAHLGGMIFGFILIMYWRNKQRRNNGFPYN